MTDEYGVKIALVEEYKKVLKYKKIYEDLIESFQSIICDLFHYAEKNHIDLPNRARVYRNMDRARTLIEYRIDSMEPDESLQRKKERQI